VSQHFEHPEEPGTPGVERYRKARAALAVFEQEKARISRETPTEAVVWRRVAKELAAALKGLMPTYDVIEVVDSGATWTETTTAAKDLPSYAAAQQWIADNDPAARRVFGIRVQS
jgi:hypothetical protein